MDFPLPAKKFFYILLSSVKLDKVPQRPFGVIEGGEKRLFTLPGFTTICVDLLLHETNPRNVGRGVSFRNGCK